MRETLQKLLAENQKSLNELRVKIIAFYAFDEEPMIETPFLPLMSKRKNVWNFLRTSSLYGG